MKTVVVTKRVLEIGKIYQGLVTDPWSEPRPEQYFKVVATAAEKDWIDFLVSVQGEQERSWHEMVASIDGPWNYYEVQTD